MSWGGHDSDVLRCLRAVEDSLVARHLMTPVADLVTAHGDDRASELAEHHDFEVIPRVTDGRIQDYWWRRAGRREAILMGMVVAGDTRVLDLLDFFVDHRFGFVLIGRSVGGYLHYSDLNKQPVKIAFYVQFEAIERVMRNRLARELDKNPTLLEQGLGRQKAARIRGSYESAKRDDVDIGIVNAIFSFSNLLTLATEGGLVCLSGEEIAAITAARNRLMHANEPLLRSHADVAGLIWLRDALPRLG